MGENIPAPADGVPFNLDEYMKSIGRSPPPVIQREHIEDLPTPRLLHAVYDGWVYESELMRHNGEWKITVNSERGGNSYFGAVAMIIYGDAKWWFWVRIQHLQFFEQVLQSDPPHPRRELYMRFNSEKSGPNNFTLLERLSTTDCWVDHQLLSQVSADLYGIYLVIYTHHSGREGTPSLPVFHEVYTTVRARGNYNSSHRFLRYTDNRHYQPIVPANSLHPSEYQAPRLTTKEATGVAGPNISAEEARIRRPYPDVAVPERLVPTPITTLILKNLNTYLEKILWVILVPGSPDHDEQAPTQLQPPKWEDVRGLGKSWAAINMNTNGQSSFACQGPYNVEHPHPDVLEMLPSVPSSPNYFRKPLKELEKLIAERNIQIPSCVKNIVDLEARKKRYAAYLEGNDVEKGTGGRRLLDMIDYADGPRRVTGDKTTTRIANREERSGSVLRQITITTITRTVTSVPYSREQILPGESKALSSPDSHEGIHLNTDEQLQQLLLGANLNVTGDRETDIEIYRAFMRENTRSSSLQQRNSMAEVEVENELDGRSESSGRFNTTINVNIYSGAHSAKRKLPSASPETKESQPESSEEDAILDVEGREDPPSSPEPQSPLVNDYCTWSAAALKRNAMNRVPPIKIPSKQKAEETRKVLPEQLKALDEKAKVAREDIRANKRARAEQRRLDAKRGERSVKRIKLVIKDTGKARENDMDEDNGGDGEMGEGLSGVVHGETDEQEMRYHTTDGSCMQSPKESKYDGREDFVVETPEKSENVPAVPRKKHLEESSML